MRKSLLVEQGSAVNDRESSWVPKQRMTGLASVVVDERSSPRRSHTVRSGGAAGSENAGMSNDKAGENPARRKPKVSWGR